MSESVLEEAQRIIHTDRNADYGHPLDDFGCTAAMWTTWLNHKYYLPVGFEFSAEDVGLMMVMVKLSREANRPQRDNLTDGAGYLGTIEMIQDERERREIA